MRRRHLPPVFVALALFGSYVLAVAGAEGRVTPRIINGTAPSRDWPAQGLVQIAQGGVTYQCGGTLLSGRWLLTAGHCVTVINRTDVVSASQLTVTLGTANLSSVAAENRYGVSEVLRHEGFTRSSAGAPSNDLALLHLDRPAPQEPLPLVGADESALWAPGVRATAIGWGTTSPTRRTGPTTTLMETQLPMVSDATCAADYAGNGPAFDPNVMVCAGDGNTDTCSGDSGGPLMAPRGGELVLVGVTSFGPETCADATHPGVYTRVGAPALNGWIRQRIPTASLTSSETPVAGRPVTLTAGVSHPAGQADPSGYAWDLDGDRAFDDAVGASPTTTFPAAGTYSLAVTELYPDGDRAVGRGLVTVATAGPPPTGGGSDSGAPPRSATSTRIAVLAPRLRSVRARDLRRGRVGVRMRCSVACTLNGRFLLTASSARRLGLTRGNRPVWIAKGSKRRHSAGLLRITLRVPVSVRRVLRRHSVRGPVTLRVAARGGGRNETRSTRLRLRR